MGFPEKVLSNDSFKRFFQTILSNSLLRQPAKTEALKQKQRGKVG
jgi:hypothetical protein